MLSRQRHVAVLVWITLGLAAFLFAWMLWPTLPAPPHRAANPVAPNAVALLPAAAALPATPNQVALPPVPATTPQPSLTKSSHGQVRTLLLNDAPEPGKPAEEIALRAIQRHERALAPPFAPGGWSRTLRHVDNRAAAGGHVVRFEQFCRGVPVLGGGATVLVDAQGSAQYVTAQAQLELPAQLTAVPDVSDTEALAVAAADFDVEEGITAALPSLFVVRDAPAAALAWVVPVTTEAPFGSFLVHIDAHTGDVIETIDVLKTATGSGRVFRPNPVASSGNLGLRDNFDRRSDSLDAALASVALDELDGSGLLRGPLVDVITGDGSQRVSSNSLEFNFTREEPGFEQTMCYHYLQSTLAYLGELGRPNPLERTLTTQARFSPRGEEELNAFFDPNSGFVLFGTEGVDLAEDATVIVHELGHALQDAAASRPGRPFGLTYEGSAVGEGFSDFWAASVLSDLLVAEPNFIAHWISYGDLDYPFGNSLFAGLHRRIDSEKVWPRDADPGRDPHLDGEIWSSALWRVRNLIGRDNANRLVIESHYLLAPEARFQDASLALLAANRTLFGGANEAEFTAILQARGVFEPAGTSPDDDNFEDNDSPLEAADVLLGERSVVVVDLVALDDDWFLVPVQVGDLLDVQIQFVNQNGDLDLGIDVLDPNAAALANIGSSAGDDNLERLTIDTGGTLRALADEDGIIYFFVLVTGFQGATNDYALSVNVATPGSQTQAIELALGDKLEANAAAGDIDVIQFEALAGMVLSVATKKTGSAGAVVDAALVSDEGAVFDFGAGGLSSRGLKRSVGLPVTGTYTLFLQALAGSSGPYSLQLKAKAPKAKFKQTLSFSSDEELGYFEADGLAGSRLVLKAKAKGKNPDGSRLAPVVAAFDTEGELLGANAAPLGETSAVLDLILPSTGTFYGVVAPQEGSLGTATVTAQLKLPKSKRVLRETID